MTISVTSTSTRRRAAFPKREYLRVTGAGRSVTVSNIDGYLAARLLGRDAASAAAIGNRLAAAKVQHPGAIMPRDAMPDLGLT